MFILFIRPSESLARHGKHTTGVHMKQNDDSITCTTAKLLTALRLASTFKVYRRRSVPLMPQYRSVLGMRLLLVLLSAALGFMFVAGGFFMSEEMASRITVGLIGISITVLIAMIWLLASPEVAYQRLRYQLFMRVGSDLNMVERGGRGCYYLHVEDTRHNSVLWIKEEGTSIDSWVSSHLMPMTNKPNAVSHLLAAEILKNVKGRTPINEEGIINVNN